MSHNWQYSASTPHIPFARYYHVTRPAPSKRSPRLALDTGDSEGMKAFKQSASKPYYLLSAKELDIVIYYHTKYLRLMRQDKLADAKHANTGKPVFFTNVDVEQGKTANDCEDTELRKDTLTNRDARSVQSLRRPVRTDGASAGKFERSAGVAGKKTKQPPWMKKKRGPKFLLDFRRTKPEQIEEHTADSPEPIKKLRKMYYNNPVPNRATYFIPKLKGPRNPQLAKIQAYFVL